MPLVHLLYASVAKPDVKLKALEAIMTEAGRANHARDITGLLVLSNGYFLQVLEGERQAVSELFLRIARDPRHDACELLALAEIDTRGFAEWSMKLVAPDSFEQGPRRRALLKHAGTARLDPHRMTAAQCYQLLRTVADLERQGPT